jgi:hypothetical protein
MQELYSELACRTVVGDNTKQRRSRTHPLGGVVVKIVETQCVASKVRITCRRETQSIGSLQII